MIEELASGNNASNRSTDRWKAKLIKLTARMFLNWKPKGTLLIELPDGQRVRFGKGPRPSEPVLKIVNYKAISKTLRRGAIGFAEAFIDGEVRCEQLTQLFQFFIVNRDRLIATGGVFFKSRMHDRIAHLLRRNSRDGSRRNISEHYDLGNAFFELWLDKSMIYSSGLFKDSLDTLEVAQAAKVDLVLEMLDLDGGEHILEIGCGWGGFAMAAARRENAKIRAITLSQEQLAFCRIQGCKNQIDPEPEFVLEDYRDTNGSFDHIVSIEMIEAVGEQYWPDYFQTLADRLKPGGTAVLQAITIDEQHYDNYRRKADFIQRYIFPGGMLPTKSLIDSLASSSGLVLERRVVFGQSYARTLNEWLQRFDVAWPRIAELGFDDRFRRIWRYYLAYCEAGFLEQSIDVGLYRLRKL